MAKEVIVNLAGGAPNDDFVYWNLVIRAGDKHYVYLSFAIKLVAI